MTDKTTLLEAIDNFEVYTKNQRGVLKTLVTLSVDSFVNIKSEYVQKVVNISNQTVYANLRRFQKDGLVTRINQKGKFQLNDEKLQDIVRMHNNKKTLEYNKSF